MGSYIIRTPGQRIAIGSVPPGRPVSVVETVHEDEWQELEEPEVACVTRTHGTIAPGVEPYPGLDRDPNYRR